MTMTPRLPKVALTAHVTSSVGWLGAVSGFLARAVAALTSQDAQTVRAAYLVMEPAAWFVLVLFALASLLTEMAPAHRCARGAGPRGAYAAGHDPLRAASATLTAVPVLEADPTLQPIPLFSSEAGSGRY